MSHRSWTRAARIVLASVALICPGARATASEQGASSPTPPPAPSAVEGAPGVPAAAPGHAQEGSSSGSTALRVTVDPPSARIGDAIRITAVLDSPEPWMADASGPLKPGETLGPFRIVDLDVSRPGTIVLTVTPDEPGTLDFPGFETVFKLAGRDDMHVSVPPSKISIASILGEGDATLADIKPPAELPVPWPWRTIGLAALGGAAAVALAILARRWMRKPPRPAVRPEEQLPPGVTADAWARAQLEALLGQSLREAGRHRDFHIELADLVRRYLEIRYQIPALERTTEEVGFEMNHALLPEKAADLASDALRRCDHVKFAKHVPSMPESDRTVLLVRELIDCTAPASSPAAPAADARAVPEGTAA